MILITLEDENSYNKSLHALKKYNTLAYKQLYFEIFPQIKDAHFPGEYSDGIYRVPLKVSELFSFIYGTIYLSYTVQDNVVCIKGIQPYATLLNLYSAMHPTHMGVPICDDKAAWKLQLFLAMKGVKSGSKKYKKSSKRL